MLKDDSEKMVIGMLIGLVIGLGLRCLPRYCETHVSLTQAMPWHYYGIYTILLTVAAVVFQGPDQWLWIVAAAISLLVTLWKFRKQRVQFSVRSMLLVTLFVAMICSARYYVPLTALLALLAMPAMEWTRLEEARRLALLPPLDRSEEADSQ